VIGNFDQKNTYQNTEAFHAPQEYRVDGKNTLKKTFAGQWRPWAPMQIRFRGHLIDIAGKIVSHGGKIILKISAACFESLRFEELFERCKQAPPIR